MDAAQQAFQSVAARDDPAVGRGHRRRSPPGRHAQRRGGWLWVSASTDRGQTWAEPADGGFVNPGTPAQLLRLAGGNLALVFNDSATQRRRLSIALSADDGRTWPHRRVLVDGELKYSYPAAAQTPDGLIHILYSHDRRRIGHITCNEAWIAADQ